MAMETFILIRVHPFQRSLLILTGPVPSWYEPTKTGFYVKRLRRWPTSSSNPPPKKMDTYLTTISIHKFLLLFCRDFLLHLLGLATNQKTVGVPTPELGPRLGCCRQLICGGCAGGRSSLAGHIEATLGALDRHHLLVLNMLVHQPILGDVHEMEIIVRSIANKNEERSFSLACPFCLSSPCWWNGSDLQPNAKQEPMKRNGTES